MSSLLRCFVLLLLLPLGCSEDQESGADPKDSGGSSLDGGVEICGDEVRDPGEECDDGNINSGDGCSQTCEHEDPRDLQIKINEILAKDSEGGPDWIELYNPSQESVDLEGWVIKDGSDAEGALLPAGLLVPAQGFLLLTQDQEFSFGLGKEDSLQLLFPGGQPADASSWVEGDAPEGQTWGRIPDGLGAFKTLTTPTPGAANRDGGESATCGDGIIAESEACDDGNTESGDGCDEECQLEEQVVCGDGVLAGDELCDDGNTEAGDGCDEECRFELPEMPQVIINELSARALDGGPDWVELYNPGEEQVDLSAWILTDSDTEAHRSELGGSLAPGAFLLLIKDQEFDFGLGSADSVLLFNAQGVLVDMTAWEEEQAPEGQSWGRIPDATGPFQTLEVPSPGAPNIPNAEGCGDGIVQEGEECDDGNLESGDGCSEICTDEDPVEPLYSVVINEVMIQDAEGGPDWVELYNFGEEGVDLNAWILTDSDIEGHRYNLPVEAYLEPRGFLLLSRGTEFDFGLGGEDELHLFDAEGQVVDELAWVDGSGPETQTWGRLPDAQGPFQNLSPTPGAPNQAPVVQGICGDGILDEGEECDDGNLESGDGCSEICTDEDPIEPRCGDGILSEGEECDDGNAEAGDGCLSCLFELRINEVMPRDLDGGPDWIELINLSEAELNLEGWVITDSDQEVHRYTLEANSLIPPGGYLVLIKDLQFDFGLGGSDEVHLFDAQGQARDGTAWFDAVDGESWARRPNGTGDFQMGAPSQGAAN